MSIKTLIKKMYINKKAKEFSNPNDKVIIDTHTHMLGDKVFLGPLRKTFVMAAKQNRIVQLSLAIDPETSKDVINLNKKYPWVIPCIGSHALFIDRYKDGDIDKIDNLITDKVKAIGEVGLDYRESTTPEIKELQKSNLIKLINVAEKHNLPVIIHTRESVKDVIEIVKEYPEQKFVMHCWEGDVKDTKELLEFSKNIWFGYGAKITLNDESISKARRETIKLIPSDRLLIETDSPSPRAMSQMAIDRDEKANFPWLTRELFTWLSDFLNEDLNSLIDRCNNNAIDFYNLDKDILNIFDK